jgi:hypothetical protein
MKHLLPAFALLFAACSSPAPEAATEAPAPVLECTPERAYERAIQGVQEKLDGMGHLSTYDYTSEQVTNDTLDYSYWVATEAVTGGSVRHRIEAGLVCLDGGVLGLGWLDIQPIE